MNFKSITEREAKDLLENTTGYTLVDVRTPGEYKNGHIPGAINIPNETIAGQPIAQLPDKNQLTYVYCRSGARSKAASKKLAALGYTNIVEMGGVINWPGNLVK